MPSSRHGHAAAPMDKYGLISNNPAFATIDNAIANMDNALKKNSNALPAIMAPNNGAVQPYSGVSDSEDETDNDRKAGLEYNQKKALEDGTTKTTKAKETTEAATDKKSHNPATTTTIK